MRIWHFILGYVMIRIEGLSLERFLNISAQADVKVFDARRVSYTVLNATLKHSDFRRLQKQGARPIPYHGE